MDEEFPWTDIRIPDLISIKTMYETKHGIAGSKPKQVPTDISFISQYSTDVITEIANNSMYSYKNLI